VTVVDHLQTLDYALEELRRVVGALDESVMESPTNCEPWSVRRLASHALNNQLVWAGLVTGQQIVALDDAMGAVPIDGDLGPIAGDVTARAFELWSSEGVLDAMHTTPFGELPGAVVIDFAIVDAAAHAWDLSASVGRPLEFDPAHIPVLTDVVEATCTDAAREIGLIQPPTDLPEGATDTERLLSAAGRAIPR
jgi:uncharacterized protein (TIGR03086 family)